MKNKSKIIILYTTIFLFMLSTAYTCVGSSVTIYGQVQYENGNIAQGAFVNVTSDRGYLTTTVDHGGYWQVNCGDPINWPNGTLINIKINITKNGRTWDGGKNAIIDSYYINTGTIILYSNDSSNIKPIANITFDTSNEYYIGDSIIFDASNSYDLDGEIIEYRWFFTKNENVQNINSSNPIISYIFTEPGQYIIELQIIDDYQDIDNETSIINILNISTMLNINNKNNNVDNNREGDQGTPGFCIILVFITLAISVIIYKKYKKI